MLGGDCAGAQTASAEAQCCNNDGSDKEFEDFFGDHFQSEENEENIVKISKCTFFPPI